MSHNQANGPSDVVDYETLVHQSREALRIKTAAQDRIWGIGAADWVLDQDSGVIRFQTADGRELSAAVQVIGTWNAGDGTWLWAWDNPSIDPELRTHAVSLRQFGEKRGIKSLTDRKFHCSEADAWQLAALACQINDAQGAYRGLAGATMIFMTFGEVAVDAEPLE